MVWSTHPQPQALIRFSAPLPPPAVSHSNCRLATGKLLAPAVSTVIMQLLRGKLMRTDSGVKFSVEQRMETLLVSVTYVWTHPSGIHSFLRRLLLFLTWSAIFKKASRELHTAFRIQRTNLTKKLFNQGLWHVSVGISSCLEGVFTHQGFNTSKK